MAEMKSLSSWLDNGNDWRQSFATYEFALFIDSSIFEHSGQFYPIADLHSKC